MGASYGWQCRQWQQIADDLLETPEVFEVDALPAPGATGKLTWVVEVPTRPLHVALNDATTMESVVVSPWYDFHQDETLVVEGNVYVDANETQKIPMILK